MPEHCCQFLHIARFDQFRAGAVVTEHLGRVPRRGEEAIIGNVRFAVLRADGRRVDVLRVDKLPIDERNDDAG